MRVQVLHENGKMPIQSWHLPVQLLDSTSTLNLQDSSHGRAIRTLAQASFGRGIVAIEIGGDRLPAIVLAAGAHPTEIEGILAAIYLIETLETEHRTSVVPT